jgi:hypothetical protein
MLWLTSFTVSGLANSYSVGLIELPKEQDIAAFTNERPPATGSRVKKSREEITKFLRLGKYTAKFPTDKQRAMLALQINLSEGVFTDQRGKFYFWTLIADNVLWLQTPEGGGAVLEIKE